MKVHDLPTPSLIVDLAAFDRNVAAMGERWPGTTLRPHVKAFKSTALARRLVAAGHSAFCCATVREVVGMASAGLGDDLLLANESLDLARLTPVVEGGARVTVAVDSEETITAAVRAGVPEVLVDVDVGMPRCGCEPADAGRLADLARGKGLGVRGVMGYEGHLMREPGDTKADLVERSMALLLEAHAAVGGDVVSGGGTGTWDINTWVTELQAGSYCLMDTEYVPHSGGGFDHALFVQSTVISTSPKGWGVLDAGLKAFGMDHGDPTVLGVGDCWFVSDEHITFGIADGVEVRVGEKARVIPAHVDPTVSQHERMHVIEGDEVVDTWEVDLRGW